MKLFNVLVWLFKIFCSLSVDSRLWGEKEKDPPWLKKWFDAIWLIGLTGVTPFLFIYLGVHYREICPDFFLFIAWNALFFFSCGFIWDMVYSKIEYGKWIYPLKDGWFKIPGVIDISFASEEEILTFNIFRMVLFCFCLYLLFF